MTKRARGMDAGKIKTEDVARSGGAPEAARMTQRQPPRAVIFDLDGTLDRSAARLRRDPRRDRPAAGAARSSSSSPTPTPRRARARRGDHAPARARRPSPAPRWPTAAPICSATCAALRDPDGDPDPQRARGRRDLRAHVRRSASTPSTRARTGRPNRRPPACCRCAARWASRPPTRWPSATTSSTSSPDATPAAARCSSSRPAGRPTSSPTGARPIWSSRSLRELLPMFGPLDLRLTATSRPPLSAGGPGPPPETAARPAEQLRVAR